MIVDQLHDRTLSDTRSITNTVDIQNTISYQLRIITQFHATQPCRADLNTKLTNHFRQYLQIEISLKVKGLDLLVLQKLLYQFLKRRLDSRDRIYHSGSDLS